MIYDTLEHLDAYRGVHPGVMRGLELLRDTDFSQWEDGRHEIDGERLFVLLQSYETKLENDTPEAHKKYIDIQYLLSGQELLPGFLQVAKKVHLIPLNAGLPAYIPHGFPIRPVQGFVAGDVLHPVALSISDLLLLFSGGFPALVSCLPPPFQ